MNWQWPACRFVLAEESVFFEKKFRNPDFSVADTAIELHDVEGETLLVRCVVIVNGHEFSSTMLCLVT